MRSDIYKGRSGQWAFLTHRVTGVLVLLFLLMHIVDVSLINSNMELYNDVHQLYGKPLLRLFEVGLLAGLLFHSLNGIRIIIYDFISGAMRFQKQMFAGVLFITAMLTVIGGYVILLPIFSGDV